MRKVLPVVIATLMIACKKNNDNPNEVNSTDKAFLIQIYQASRDEIKAGKLAMDRANDPAVRRLGEDILAGYQSAQSDLIDVANKLSLSLTDTAMVHAQGGAALGEISSYSFDTAYVQSRTRSQLAILHLFQDELNNGNNPYVRYYFLNRHIDKVRTYLHQADSLSRAL